MCAQPTLHKMMNSQTGHNAVSTLVSPFFILSLFASFPWSCWCMEQSWEWQYIYPYTLLFQVAVVEDGDLIAKRTRSQLPLQDVPIESIEGIPRFARCWICLICFAFEQLKKRLTNGRLFVVHSNIPTSRLHCGHVWYNPGRWFGLWRHWMAEVASGTYKLRYTAGQDWRHVLQPSPPQGGGVDPRKLGCDVCNTLSKILHPI